MDKEKKRSIKGNLRLVEKYDNDDHSRYAGPDYSEEPFEIGQEDFEQSAHTDKSSIHVRGEGSWHHPGVSGKSEEGETWLNQKEYSEQTNFVGYGPKNYKRSDDRIYEEVCEALMQNTDVDATNIGVKVENGVVYLTGKTNDRFSKKMAGIVIEDLPGVQDVRNELSVFRNSAKISGPDSVIGKDLGIN